MTPAAAAAFMAQALRLAEHGIYTTPPNSRVGCVIVRDGEVIGEGAHLRPGEPHAAVHPMRMASERARGDDLLVTLDPGAHHDAHTPYAAAVLPAGLPSVRGAGRETDAH